MTAIRKSEQQELFEREQRGMRIAATCKLTKKGQVWLRLHNRGMAATPSAPTPKRPTVPALTMKHEG